MVAIKTFGVKMTLAPLNVWPEILCL